MKLHEDVWVSQPAELWAGVTSALTRSLITTEPLSPLWSPSLRSFTPQRRGYNDKLAFDILLLTSYNNTTEGAIVEGWPGYWTYTRSVLERPGFCDGVLSSPICHAEVREHRHRSAAVRLRETFHALTNFSFHSSHRVAGLPWKPH